MLACVQGIAEFIPISSSGHLVILQYFFGFEEPQLFLNIVLHVGTLIAVVIFFRTLLVGIIADIKGLINKKLIFNESTLKLALFAIVASIPALCAVIVFEKYYIESFNSIVLPANLLIINGFILLTASYRKHITKDVKQFDVGDAILIGCAQCIAIFPGISRSGTTITCALLCGVNPGLAFQFSFLLAIPAILGALLYDIKELFTLSNIVIIKYLCGMVVSACIGYISLIILGKFVIKNRLYVFSIYCWLIGCLILIFR